MKYNYQAKKISGEETEGIREAKDRFELARSLRAEGYILTSFREEELAKKKFSLDALGLGAVSMVDKMIFARNLGAMVSAGVPIVRSIDTLSRQTRNKKFRQTLVNLSDGIRKGKSLSEVTASFPKIFSLLFVAMVKVGEESGNLSESLKLIASQLERDNTLRRRIRGALMYPAIILIAMGGIGALMMIYVVPTLLMTFKELGTKLPMSTRIIISTSNFLSTHILVSITVFPLLLIFFIWVLQTERGKRVVSNILLFLPIFSTLVKKINSARTSRTLASLIGSGVNIVESLNITKDVLQNHRYKAILEEAKEKVQKGSPISEAFLRHENLYPSLLGEMMAAGEETGKMAEMLTRLADFYEEEVADMTKDLSTIVEPIILIVIGIVVGFFTIAMVKPLYSVLDTI
ncbi:MAG TPA: type II secretion system F family protein [Candidatus Paceibacterota bacterium]